MLLGLVDRQRVRRHGAVRAAPAAAPPDHTAGDEKFGANPREDFDGSGWFLRDIFCLFFF